MTAPTRAASTATAPTRPAVPPTPVRLDLAAGSLVVVAGLPGAGKTTLLRRLSRYDGVRALDAEDVAGRLTGLPLPYRVLRPLVHTAHLVRVVAALWSAHPRVLTTDPFTSPLRRGVLRTAAHLSGRRLQVVRLDASPAQARDGQQRRGRRLSRRRTARHEQRYLRWVAAGGHDPDVVLSRQQATRVVLHTGVADRAASGHAGSAAS